MSPRLLIAQSYGLAAIPTTTHGLYLLSGNLAAIAMPSRVRLRLRFKRLENQKREPSLVPPRLLRVIIFDTDYNYKF